MRAATAAAALYSIARSEGRTEFRPSPLLARAMAGAFTAGGLFSLYLVWIPFSRSTRSGAALGLASVLGGVAAFCAYLAVRAWRSLTAAALTVEPDGRVSFGEAELCAPGSVVAVHVLSDEDEEGGERFKAVLQTAEGGFAGIPSPYLASFPSAETARSFAGALAEALNVELIESP